MTEAEWLACTEPTPMLEFLRDKVSDRKLRLLACAVAPVLLGEAGEEDSRRKIDAIEGLAEYADLKQFAPMMCTVRSHKRGTFYNYLHPDAPPYVMPGSIMIPGITFGRVDSEDGIEELDADFFGVVVEVVADSGTVVEELAPLCHMISLDDVEAIYDDDYWHEPMTHLIRDIFGNPFRPVSVNPAWQTPTVLALAQAAYDERALPSGELDPVRLAVLADAVEEAGCDNADILTHLRQSDIHVRGCWAVGLLGKE
jgi:hypothetical protein